MTIEFFHEMTVPKSTAQQRQQYGNGKSALTPSAVKAKATWQAVMELYKPAEPMTGPVAVVVEFSFERDQIGRTPKNTKPDLDNMMKLVFDAMTKAGYWKDDAQVAQMTVSKSWAPMGGVHVVVEEAK